MTYFLSADTQRYLQDFRTGDLLAQSGIKARTCLLNKTEVKRGDVSDRLNIGQSEVGVGPGNSRDIGQRNCLLEGGSEIGICRAAVPGIPAGVHREVHEVGEPANILGAICLATRQSTVLIEVHGRRTNRFNVRME